MSDLTSSPYPGLRPFRMDEDYLFFGREEQTAELVKLLREHRFLAVVGRSGSGKSSLVRAGLLPAIQGGMMQHASSAWEIAVLRPGGHPIGNLAECLIEADLYDREDEEALPRLLSTLNHSALGLVQAYHQSASTLNLLRAFTKGGFADLSRVHAWTQEFVASSPEGQRYEHVAAEIERALAFMRACGIDTESNPNLAQVDVFTSHEALILGYEEALTRQDSLTGGWFDCSAHMLWIGERTRELDGAHVEFLRGVGNPIGCKVGPTTTAEYVLELCELLNPSRIPGRLTLIVRMGADKVESSLRPLLRAVTDAGHPIVWACDPMHANTYTAANGLKTRHFDDVVAEIGGFVRAHRAEGTWPGGIHIELTGEDVTECLGGGDALSDTDLDHRYETMCDPRLNARQSVDLSFRVAELLRQFT